jgi:hypothetical protein
MMTKKVTHFPPGCEQKVRYHLPEPAVMKIPTKAYDKAAIMTTKALT